MAGSGFLRVTMFVFLFAAFRFAPLNTGTISGTGSDATGAVAPGAAVTVKNADAGLTPSLEGEAVPIRAVKAK